MKRLSALLLILALLLCACSPKTGNQWQEQYDLGMKYLGQGEYARAIEAFTAAIEIDPQRNEAYVQRAEAYVRLARQLSEYLSGGTDQELPQLPADPPSPGLANPQEPDETRSPGSSQDSQELTPPGDLPDDSGSTQATDAPDQDTQPGESVPAESAPGDLPDDAPDGTTVPGGGEEDADSEKSLADRIRELIKKYLDRAKKDYEHAKELSPGDEDALDDKIDDIPSEDELIPETPEPDLSDLIDRLDYAMLLSALEGIGCYNVQWELEDPDADGDSELLVQTEASIAGIPSQLIFDVRSGSAVSFTAAGAAQSSNFVLYADGTYGFYTGYHTAVNSEDHFYTWNGSGWVETADGVSGASHLINLSSPELSCFVSPDNFNATRVTLENDYMTREGFLGSIQADFEEDGIPEQVYLLRYAGRDLLSRIYAGNAWGDEAFLNAYDDMGYAVIVSQDADRTLVTVSRIEIPATDLCYVEGSALIIGEVTHYYDSTTHAFGFSEVVIADNVVDFTYFRLALPDSWENRYVYDIYEEPYLDGIPATYYVSFYEAGEYYQTGAGHLFTIAMIVDELGGFEFADADLMGIFYYGSPANPDCLTYSVYAVYPTDVQFSAENADSYMRLYQDIYPILLSYDVDPDYFYFHSYYTDTH